MKLVRNSFKYWEFIRNLRNNEEVKDLLKIKDDDNSEDSSSGSDLLNNMKKKIQ